MRTQAAQRQPAEAKCSTTLETHDPDAPIEPPNEDLDPDLLPEEEDDDYSLPGDDEEHASPAVEPHEEPLVTP